MKVELNLYATLRRYLPSQEEEGGNIVETKEGITVEELLTGFDVPVDTVKIVFVNGVHAEIDHRLAEGDRVGVFPPVGGG